MAAKGIEARLTRIEDAVGQKRLDEPLLMSDDEQLEFACGLVWDIVEGGTGRMRRKFEDLERLDRDIVRSLLNFFSKCGAWDDFGLPDGAAQQIGAWLTEQRLQVV